MFPIIGKKFSAEDFEKYVAGISLAAWKPKFVVIHNTASPSLAQRPNGLTYQHITNLQSYYAGKGWNGGPHLFVDDTGIWVFNPLDRRGTHSPSWNSEAWGIELLGDYSTESPTEGRGELVVEDGTKAAGILLKKLGLEPNDKTIRFHKEDKATDHDCPGKLLTKSYFLEQVRLYLDSPAAPSGWSVVGPDGNTILDGLEVGAKGTGIVRAVWEASGGIVDPDSEKRVIRLVVTQ